MMRVRNAVATRKGRYKGRQVQRHTRRTRPAAERAYAACAWLTRLCGDIGLREPLVGELAGEAEAEAVAAGAGVVSTTGAADSAAAHAVFACSRFALTACTAVPRGVI